jgi:uncharacterized membrane protein
VTGFAAIVISARDWMLFTTVALLILAAALVWSTRHGSTRDVVRIVCGLLKLVGIALLLVALLEPLWVSQRARPGANVFAILADNSQSMNVKDAAESESRGDTVRHQLAGESGRWQSSLQENFQVRRYLFDSRLHNTRDFEELVFDGRTSALGSALNSAIEQWRGQPVAGVLLFSDGNATDIAGDLMLENSPPVYPVVAGRKSDIRDIAIQKVGVSQTAFEDAPVTVQASVRASDFGGTEVVARLTQVAVRSPESKTNQLNQLVALQPASGPDRVTEVSQFARGAQADLNFRFQVQPDQPGIHFYELETRSREESQNPAVSTREATQLNNRRMLVVDRGQEPFRVLYVSGRPNWEYKFLNRAIQEDRQVQMVSLIRVARREPKFEFKGRVGESSNPLFRGFDETDEETARYDQPVMVRLNTRDELELRGGFPKLAEELFEYHAVILDDVEAEFFTRDQMSLLQRFVAERGGGFLMLGGAESFREGNYSGTTIASLLPVYVDRASEVELPAQLKLNLTREGWLQPWTRLRPTESDETMRLESMPAFEVFNPVKDIKPGASVLATVSDSDDRAYPALVVQRFGMGRSAALMIGDLWRWGLQDEVMQRDLGKSWRQLVRWLVADVPSRVMVAAERAETGDAAEIRLSVKVRDPDFKPLDNATVALTVRPVKAGQRSTDAATNSGGGFVQLAAEPSSRELGTYEATYIAREPGAYLVEAVVTASDGKVVGRAAAGWASEPDAEEFRSLQPNLALLESIARKTGGELVTMDDLEKFVRRLPDRRAPVTEATSFPLWHRPEVLLLVIGCFLAEWGIRRWKGLP